jgi:hypothetical protein
MEAKPQWHVSLLDKPRQSGEYDVKRHANDADDAIVVMRFDAEAGLWLSGKPAPNNYVLLPADALWKKRTTKKPPPGEPGGGKAANL